MTNYDNKEENGEKHIFINIFSSSSSISTLF